MNAIGRSSQRAVCSTGASVGPAGNALIAGSASVPAAWPRGRPRTAGRSRRARARARARRQRDLVAPRRRRQLHADRQPVGRRPAAHGRRRPSPTCSAASCSSCGWRPRRGAAPRSGRRGRGRRRRARAKRRQLGPVGVPAPEQVVGDRLGAVGRPDLLGEGVAAAGRRDVGRRRAPASASARGGGGDDARGVGVGRRDPVVGEHRDPQPAARWPSTTSDAAITDSTSATSATERARMPIWVRGSRSGPTGPRSSKTPAIGTRPAVGFNAARPQKCAGSRTLAPESVPSPNAEQPAATAAASPPLDPPTECDSAYGLLVRPKTSLSVSIPPPHGGRFVLPRKIAPASRSRATATASAAARDARALGHADDERQRRRPRCCP